MRMKIFEKAELEVEDIFLLEAFQTAYLPGRVPERAFAAVLHAYPVMERFLRKKCPDVVPFLERIKSEHGPSAESDELARFERAVVDTIADLLTYNRCPEIYDEADFHGWDFSEVTSITSLDGKVVIDGGAGTGRVCLEVACSAKYVFAVEPVARLRQFIRDKAATAGLNNLFVIDGLLHAIPLPDDFADELITSHALGWQLEDELRELLRVVKPGGHIIHCPGTAYVSREETTHQTLISPEWGYQFSIYEEADGPKRKYWRTAPGRWQKPVCCTGANQKGGPR